MVMTAWLHKAHFFRNQILAKKSFSISGHLHFLPPKKEPSGTESTDNLLDTFMKGTEFGRIQNFILFSSRFQLEGPLVKTSK
jgi:hypothetical protein